LLPIKPSTRADPLEPVPAQLLPEGLEPIHRAGCQSAASAEVLDDLQPFLVVQTQALEDRLEVGQYCAVFVVVHRSAGPVHQLQVIRQGEGDTLGCVGMLTAHERR